MGKPLTFDEVFKIWFDAEVTQIEGRNILPVAQSKGFTSIAEWRLSAALRMGLDKLSWEMETIENPAQALLDVIIGPYKGWSKFFDNQLNTSFKEGMEIPEFFEWCKSHDRIIPLSKNFPLPTTVILLRRPDGKLIHIEGGHRICTVAYLNKLGQPIDFPAGSVTAAVASITEENMPALREYLRLGSDKQPKTP